MMHRAINGKHSEPDIFVSVAASGGSSTILTLLEQVAMHLAPALAVLHVSSDGMPSNTTQRALRKSLPDAVILNPVQMMVKSYTPSVLKVHISNWLFLMKNRNVQSGDKWVLLASNQILFRDCAHSVRASSLSFIVGGAADIWMFPEPGSAKVKPAALLHVPSREWSAMKTKFGTGDDRKARWGTTKGLTDWLQSQGVGYATVSPRSSNVASLFSMASPIGSHLHEGSFYPAWLFREFVDRLLKSRLNPWRACPFAPQPSRTCVYEGVRR